MSYVTYCHRIRNSCPMCGGIDAILELYSCILGSCVGRVGQITFDAGLCWVMLVIARRANE